jgi:RNA polymerase sigma factor (sigma-70 family)
MKTIVTLVPPSPHEAAFIDSLPLIEKTIRAVCRRGHVSPDEEEDFVASVRYKLIANDYAIFRQHNGKGKLSTFVYTVAFNHLIDERNAKWGRWRPTKRARELGPPAVQLEMLIHRDGTPVNDAVAIMANGPQWGMTSRSLRSLYARLPRRVPLDRRPQPLVRANHPLAPAIDVVEEDERRSQARRARQALRLALGRLPTDERRLLRQYFHEDRSVRAIAEATAQNSGALHRRLTKILGRLRVDLREQGLTDDVIRDVLLHTIDELDALVAEVCVSGARTLPPRA